MANLVSAIQHPLFGFPEKAAFGRLIPKTKILERAKPTTLLRDKLTAQIDKIIWQYKLAPETINLPACSEISEIQIFSITLKTAELNETVLRYIDQVIPYPVFYQLTFADRIKCVAAYKRPNETDNGKWIIETYFDTPWLPIDTEKTPLPIALDMADLYQQMLRCYIPLAPRLNETLKEQIARYEIVRSKQNECGKIAACLEKEKQFNRKVELNMQLNFIKKELEVLTGLL